MIINIQVEVERESGLFVSKDAIGEELTGMLDGDVYVDDSVYNILNAEVVA